MNCKCIEALTAEHKTILRISDVLEAMSSKVKTRSEYDKLDVEAILRILCIYNHDFHQAKEEGALFPVFAAACDVLQQAAVRHILLEHKQDGLLMRGIEDAVARSDAPQFAEYAMRLANMHRNHIFKEDSILFEHISDTFTVEDDSRVISEFEPFDQEFERNHKEQLMESLRVLEWKYLRRDSGQMGYRAASATG
jgi:hemerythrin-like domain-containing protein